MNKDMKNIDDFVRGKLNGYSEPENPDAWLKMKALLDDEMPERAVPFFFRMGKPVAFLGAALLVGALCVGGYQLQLSALRQKGNGIENQTTNSSQSNTRHNNRNPNTNNKTLPVKEEINKNTAENITDKAADSIVLKSNANNPTTAKNTTPHSVLPKAHSTTKIAIINKSIAANEDANNIQAKIAEDNSEAKVSIDDNNKLNTQTAQNKQAQKIVEKRRQIAQAKKQKQPLLASGAVSRKDAAITRNVAPIIEIKATGKPTSEDQSIAVKVPEKYTRKDSINATTIITREKISKDFPKRIISTQDTLATTKVAMPETAAETKPSPAINTTIISSVQPSKKLIRAATAASKRANKLALKTEAQRQKNIFASTISNNEANVKTAKQKSPLARLIESINLPQAVTNAKRDAHNAQLFAGFNLGGNYTLSANANNFVGLQFGPSAELVFNKHWSLFAGLKYFNRSGGTKTVFDNYTKESSSNIADSTKGATQYFTVRTDSTSRLFNFSTVHSFEMPLTLRYAFRKFYVMTGINIAYYLPINVEQIEKPMGNINSHMVATNTTKPMLSDTKPLLATSDFGGRFGVGYVLGAGYQISPAWQVDLRLVRAVWDNAQGNGAQKLSSDFYQLPSVQMSVGYQFGRGTKKPTFGPTDTP